MVAGARRRRRSRGLRPRPRRVRMVRERARRKRSVAPKPRGVRRHLKVRASPVAMRVQRRMQARGPRKGDQSPRKRVTGKWRHLRRAHQRRRRRRTRTCQAPRTVRLARVPRGPRIPAVCRTSGNVGARRQSLPRNHRSHRAHRTIPKTRMTASRICSRTRRKWRKLSQSRRFPNAIGPRREPRANGRWGSSVPSSPRLAGGASAGWIRHSRPPPRSLSSPSCLYKT
mmetsp:Transcript_15339/g.43507  ORF Transcript_15339/g.43507 Transcript_15339/m.43507 type:complete len:227 (+) Transcript_15339:1438-2118(+)